MNEYNTRALVLRTNANHGIRCSAADEQRLVKGLNDLLATGSMSQKEVQRLVAAFPTSFFSDNGFDTPAQYSRLLWDALETSDLKSYPQPTVPNVTNFNGPVQAQILQTGEKSKAKIIQQSQQNQLYCQMMQRKLEEVYEAIRTEIANPMERAEALAIVDKVKNVVESGEAKPSKVQKILGGLAKWTGERLNAAVDAAIEAGVNYAMRGSGG